MKNGRLDNKGYSILEVIIVVAIFALLTGVGFMGYNVLNTRQIDECAKKLKVGLETNRVTTMGKLSASVSVYEDSKGYLVLEENINGDVNTKRVGDSSLEFEYEYLDGTRYDVPDYDNKITLSFDRNSGSLKPQPGGDYIVKFIIRMNNTEMQVCIERLTGRVSVN